MAQKKISSVFMVWNSALRLVFREPKVLAPFLILAAVETVFLWILASSPHFPFNIVMAPIIRSRWSGMYLHYPYIYELVPRLFSSVSVLIGIFAGSVTNGMAVLAVYRLKNKEKLDLKGVFLSVVSRYVSLLALSGLLFFMVHFGHFHKPVISFVLAVFLQGLVVYSVPYLLVKGERFFPALIQGIGLFFKIPFKTFWLVAVPGCLYIPVSVLNSRIDVLAQRFAPEIVVPVTFLGIVVSTLIVNSLVILATTLIFLEAADEK